MTLPLGYLLRANHRSLVLPIKESYWESLLVEAFCWGCSLAEVRRALARAPRAPFESKAIVGLLHAPWPQPQAPAMSIDSMHAADASQPLLLPPLAPSAPSLAPSALPLAALGGDAPLGWHAGVAQIDTAPPSQALRIMGRSR